jgi:hypothetical protein
VQRRILIVLTVKFILVLHLLLIFVLYKKTTIVIQHIGIHRIELETDHEESINVQSDKQWYKLFSNCI